MKNILFLLIMYTFSSCPFYEYRYPIHVTNKSNGPIVAHLNVSPEDHIHIVYPDTTITRENYLYNIVILPGRKLTVDHSSVPWKEVYKKQATSDTLSFFIIHADTLQTRGIEHVSDTYKVLMRFDMSLSDLKRIGYNITYPPDQSMEGIRRYPR